MSNYNKSLLITLLIFIVGFIYLLADKITKNTELSNSKIETEIDSSKINSVNKNSNIDESPKFIYDAFSTIVGQSSNYLMPGEELEINAGIGAYSKAAEPKISIDGISVPLNDDGRATSRIKVNGSGVKSVPVMITYTKPDGTSATKALDVKYTVGIPGGLAVTPDKMNVLYVGVDNPVTIGSSSNWDNTTAAMTNGSIIGNGSLRTIRVNNIGKASITLVTENKSTTFEFRVKKIPDPIFKIGSGKARMPANEFKSQQYCRAELENFDFDVSFKLVSTTVYFSGANFPSFVTANIQGNSLASLSSYISRCGPGSVITFENVKVQGPDGIRTIDGKSIALY